MASAASAVAVTAAAAGVTATAIGTATATTATATAPPPRSASPTGTVELLPNGSGFVRVSPPEPSDDDVYISGAQVRRCELVNGDEIAGPVRAPRRSERYPSLIRVDTINGRSADEVAEGTKYEDLTCTWATDRIALDDEDATLKAIEWLTPFGRGSRVVITGGPRAGKTEALRRLAGALGRQEDLELTVVLAGVRPEEIGDWKSGATAPAVELGLAAAPDAQAQAIERTIETGRRVAARGGHAVILIDTLEHLPAPHARRILAAARNIVDGGSLTIVATAPEAVGGETTVIALDADARRQRAHPGARPGQERHAARRAARRRQGRRGDRRGARRRAARLSLTRRAPRSPSGRSAGALRGARRCGPSAR